MAGRGVFVVVIGFTLIFLIMGYLWGDVSNRAIDNYSNYYRRTIAHNIAISGANMAANQIFLDNNWAAGFPNLPFQGGIMNVRVDHLSGGIIQITSDATYETASKNVKVKLQPGNFAKYGYYVTQLQNGQFFYTGDTISGLFHTQKKLVVKGSPVFKGKATAKNGLEKLSNNPPTNPKFLGGYQGGVDLPLTWNTSITMNAAQAGGVYITPPSGKTQDVRLRFNQNGTVTYNKRINNGSWSTDSVKQLSTFAPNGVIYVQDGNAYLSGTVSGAYTIFVNSSSSNKGNVYIEDDILYKNNPLINPASPDMLGIVASNRVEISDNVANSNNVVINATIFILKKGLGLEDESIPYSGNLKIFGGLIENEAQITGIVGGGRIIHGYHEQIYFDERFLSTFPPFFPFTGKYEIVSWLE